MNRSKSLALARFHLVSMWNWRTVYYGRLIEPTAYYLFLAAGVRSLLQRVELGRG